MSVFLLGLTVLMLLVIYFDLTSFTIPNWLNAVVLLLFIPFILSAGEVVDWQSALIAFGVVFAVGFAIFVFGVMGGGDIKLFIALSPWLGWSMNLANYLITVALLGGALAVLVYLLRKICPYALPKTNLDNLPRILQDKEPIPYGLAIAGAFLYFCWAGYVPGIVPIR